jgi:hypothetical protein
MTARVEWFCNYCNPSAQRREDGDELRDGYAMLPLGVNPLGWWDVPGKGPGGEVGHACPTCVMQRPEVQHDIAQRRGAETQRLLGNLEERHPALNAVAEAFTKDERESSDPAPRWPSRTSPFGG